jgi:hypothetical protein
MPDATNTTLIAVFEDVEPAVNAIERLHEMGVSDEQMNVISGIPIQGRVLGRPGALTNVSRIGLLGAALGMVTGLFLAYGTPYLYPLPVGGQPIFPIPMGWIVTFEMTMLGLMGFSFLGLFVDSGFPSYTPMHYVPEISNGRIAILFSYPAGDEQKFVDAMKSVGAESVAPAEARHL